MPSLPPSFRAPRLPDTRQSASKRGYGRGWQRLRRSIIVERPVCQDCGRKPSEEVDHVISIAKGGDNSPENLRALCKSCHSKKTCAVDGGFGR